MTMALGTTAERVPSAYEPLALPIYEATIDDLPKDPRQWTRENVAKWVRLLTERHGLPEVSPSRFLMNGKALCLMTPSMFLDRVPLGGKLFYKDFQLRLSISLYCKK